MTALTLFDDLPGDVPAAGTSATMYGHRQNIARGHLLIETVHGDWMHVWTGGTTLRTYMPGQTEGVNLDADQLRIYGNYLLSMAERIERR